MKKKTLILFICLLSRSLIGATSFNDQVNDLSLDVENHEIELRIFEERLNNQETIIDSIRKQFLDSQFSENEKFKGKDLYVDKKLEKIISDMIKFQNFSKESTQVLDKYQNRILSLENQVNDLKAALNILADAMQTDLPQSNKMYEVKSGDTLDKIARKHRTTVRKLKDVNAMQKDKIYVGQKLKLPAT